MMAKKDFSVIAKHLHTDSFNACRASNNDPECIAYARGYADTVEAMCLAFKEINPNFKDNVFLKAIGVEV